MPNETPNYEFILYEKKGQITYVTMNRPEVRNAINDKMQEEIIDAFRQFDRDEEAGVAIFSGAGKCFTSGADVKQRQLRPPEELKKFGGPVGISVPAGGALGLGQSLNWKPVIAAVHGYVVGQGLPFVTLCDLVVASEDSRFQLTEVSRGLGGAAHWAKMHFYAPGKLVNEVALTGRWFSPQEALTMGLVNRVAPAGQHVVEAEKLANEILANPPLSVRTNVRVIRWYMLRTTEDAEVYERERKLHQTEDFREAAKAFTEKRKPVFHGR